MTTASKATAEPKSAMRAELDPWNQLLQRAKPEINPQTFSTWLQPTRFAGLNGDGVLRVAVPNAEFRDYLVENFQTLLNGLLRGKAKRIEFDCPALPPAESEPVKDEKVEERPASGCPSIPEEAWFGPARAYRDIIGPRVESSDNFHLACFLTLVGAALGKSVCMNVSKVVYPNFYTVLVGDSAWGRKGVAMAPLYDLAPEISNGIIPFSSVDSSEGLIRAIKEAQEHSSEESQQAVMITLDEYNAMLSKAKQKGSKIIPDLKRAFDSPPTLEINTSLNRVNIKKPPTISFVAASEPDDLADMRPRDLKGGLGNRQIYIPGESKEPNSRSTQPSISDWAPLISEIRETLKFYAARGTTQLRWSDEAFHEWDLFYKSARSRGKDDPLVHKLAARHCVYVPKAAMIFAAMDRSQEFVELRHVQAAVVWCDFLLDSLYFIFQNVDVKPWVKEEKDMIEYVRKNGEVRKRQFLSRFHRLGAETTERRLKYLLSDDSHPERPLRCVQRPGKMGRKVNWIVPNNLDE